MTLHSDNILFTWKSWVDSNSELVNLGARLQPKLPTIAMNIECAIVQLADRSLSPPAQRLVDLILMHARIDS